jgi:hypothetical protein
MSYFYFKAFSKSRTFSMVEIAPRARSVALLIMLKGEQTVAAPRHIAAWVPCFVVNSPSPLRKHPQIWRQGGVNAANQPHELLGKSDCAQFLPTHGFMARPEPVTLFWG